MNVLGQAILDQLASAKSHAQAPMRVDDLHARLTANATRDQLDAELDALFNGKHINRCHRERGGDAWDEVWPTGLIGVIPTWKPLTTERTPPVRPPRHTTTQRKETVMPSVSPRKYTPRGGAARVMTALLQHGPLISKALAKAAEIPLGSVYTTVQTLIDHGLAVMEKVGPHNWYMLPDQAEDFRMACIPDQAAGAADKTDSEPAAQAVDERHEEAVSQVERDIKVASTTPNPVLVPSANGLRFMVSDDASLTIVDDEQVIEIAPADAIRLAAFLAECAPVFGV